jgi:ferredoxin
MYFKYRGYQFEPGILNHDPAHPKHLDFQDRNLPAGSSPPEVNLLPRFPFDYPFFEAMHEMLESAPGSMESILKQGPWPRMDFVFPSRVPLAGLIESMHDERIKVRFARPRYPAIQNRSAAGGLGNMLEWFDVYRLLLRVSGQEPRGIPVTFTDLTAGTRAALFVEPGTPVSSILWHFRAEAPAGEVVFFDHPFVGRSLSPEDTIDEFRPHSIIVATRNLQKRASPAAVLGRMAFQNSNYSFSYLYNSTPREVGTPCQKCLHCVRICPVGIWPFMISALARCEDIKGASAYLPERCTECGLCTYICPSGIPLLHSIQSLKKELGVAK